jgi:response regulator NasT
MACVLLFAETPERAKVLCEALAREGYSVAEILFDLDALKDKVAELRPEIVVISAAAFSDAILKAAEKAGCPTVVLTEDLCPERIRAAARAGVNAHAGNTLERLAPILEAAIARFEVLRELRDELDGANTKLVERKVIERAKGILMRERNMSEEDAYRALRKHAMDNKQRIVDVAQNVLSVCELLSNGAAGGKPAPAACNSEV